ncbi:hypothetical protein [Nocardioides cavernaquae]|uniref:LppX_LprAFG lipoprotein n=1 Tax=Nocardioides cavernaquae TaxID=2321396 RepID=A0A3A5HD97_9ACTN|nr:hypothetical protein [Nocardioides cavernaquae]RJS45947.1 hypothetical protein D4739_06720 [Nocardioides cavernaquae]
MSTPRAYAATACLAVVALLASGCGNDQPDKADTAEPQSSFARQTVAEIRSATATDMGSIESFTITGDVPEQEMTFTVSLDSDGNCAGGIEAGGGKGSVVEAASGSFVTGDELFWNAFVGPEKAAQMMAVAEDAWVRTPRGAGYFLPQCDFKVIVPTLTTGDAKAATKGKESEVDGESAVAITSSEGGVTSTAWIATDAPHHLLKLTTKGGKDAGTFTLSDFDEPVDASLPADAKVIDLAPTREAE